MPFLLLMIAAFLVIGATNGYALVLAVEALSFAWSVNPVIVSLIKVAVVLSFIALFTSGRFRRPVRAVVAMRLPVRRPVVVPFKRAA